MFSKLAQLACLATYANAICLSEETCSCPDEQTPGGPLAILYSDWKCSNVFKEVTDTNVHEDATASDVYSFKLFDDKSCVCLLYFAGDMPTYNNCYGLSSDYDDDGCV